MKKKHSVESEFVSLTETRTIYDLSRRWFPSMPIPQLARMQNFGGDVTKRSFNFKHVYVSKEFLPSQPNYQDLSEVTCNNGQTKVATGHPWSHLMPAHPPTRHHWTMWTCQQYFFYQSLHFVHKSPIGTCTTGRLQTIHPRSSHRQTVALKVQGPEDF